MQTHDSSQQPLLAVVVGAPGSGKSTYARALASELKATLLDLDTMTLPLVESVMEATAIPDIDHPRVRELTRAPRYRALIDTALENLELGRSVVVVGPFTSERANPHSWAALTDLAARHGARAEMYWCDTPLDVLRKNLTRRCAPRDSAKVENLETYLSGLSLEPPISPHVRVAWPPAPMRPGTAPTSLLEAELDKLDTHARKLGGLVARATHPQGGFGWLDPFNQVAPQRGVELYIHCRMTHVAALEVLRGTEAARPLLDVGYATLTGRLHDDEHGGWFATTTDDTKAAYAHAFVILAATSLTAAGHPGGRALLDEALTCFNEHFWDEGAGMSVEQYDRAWTTCDDCRGVNANMHTTEAFLAVYDVTGDERYLHRAHRIVERVVHGIAREADWRLPEHFDSQWQVLPDYNQDRPADPFRPYGVTIGHLLEWGRLTLNLRAALGDDAPQWMLDDARALIDAGLTRGWHVDDADGFVYTTGYDDEPIVRERLHWVVCEGIAAAWALYEVTGEQGYRDWFDRLWTYARAHLLDEEHGGWVHELSPANGPSDTVWWGKPDIYHAYQATITPLLPAMVSFAGACARRYPSVIGWLPSSGKQ